MNRPPADLRFTDYQKLRRKRTLAPMVSEMGIYRQRAIQIGSGSHAES